MHTELGGVAEHSGDIVDVTDVVGLLGSSVVLVVESELESDVDDTAELVVVLVILIVLVEAGSARGSEELELEVTDIVLEVVEVGPTAKSESVSVVDEVSEVVLVEVAIAGEIESVVMDPVLLNDVLVVMSDEDALEVVATRSGVAFPVVDASIDIVVVVVDTDVELLLEPTVGSASGVLEDSVVVLVREDPVDVV